MKAGEPPTGKGTTLDTTEYDADGNAAAGAGYDGDAGQYEHDPGSWLARDGDGRVLEVDVEGHPGREASPDDGRPVAEAADLACQVTKPDGTRFVTRHADLDVARVNYPAAHGYQVDPVRGEHGVSLERELEAG